MAIGGMSACSLRNGGDVVHFEKNDVIPLSEAQVSAFSTNGVNGYVCGKLFDAQIIHDNSIYLYFTKW